MLLNLTHRYQVAMYNCEMDEIFFVTQFVKGLKQNLRDAVESQVPESVERVVMLAQIRQASVENSKLKNKPPFPVKSGKPDLKQPSASFDYWKERQLHDFRRANQLCYLCGEKFDNAHLEKCTKRPKAQLHSLTVEDLDMEHTDEVLNVLEQEDIGTPPMLSSFP